jgi:hypothetical protein
MVWIVISFFQVNEINADMIILPVFSLWKFFDAGRTGIPPTLYLSVLLSLSYTARREIRVIPSIITIFFLAVGWTLLSAWATTQLPPPPDIRGKSVPLARAGLIVSTNDGRKSVRLTADSPFPSVAFDGTLIPESQAPFEPNSAKPLSFKVDRFIFVQNVVKNFLYLAENLDQLQKMGIANLAVYTAGLVVLLVSMRFIMDLSVWALANLFLGFVAFGGILMFELFMNSSRTQRILLSIIGDRISTSLINPLVFCAMGLLIIGATGAVYLIKRQKRRRYE